jgi:MFS family permease
LGNGALVPAQSTLLAALAPADLRHRATAVSRVASNGGIGLGAALGGLVAAGGSGGLAALFVANAVTYVLYALILIATVRRDERLDPLPGGYRLLLHDRPFVHLAVTNVALIAVGWGVFTWIVPPYASEQLGASPRLIGSLLFANAVTVVFAQIPVTRLSEGRRRGPTMAVAAVAFVAACLVVVAAGFLDAAPLLFAAVVLVAIGECFHTTVLMPLVADLAPPAVRGRYMAAIGLSWWLGLAVAPTLGAQALTVSPTGTFVAAAGLALAAGVSALALGRTLPAAVNLTPQAANPRL